jgi:hypothetical protein
MLPDTRARPDAIVTVPTDGGQVTLRLSLLAGFKAALTPLR